MRGQILRHFREYQTEELANIWTTNDRTELSELAFEVIGEILSERLGELPPQNEPVYAYPEPASKEERLIELTEDLGEEPAFYEPIEALGLIDWLNWGAKAALVVSIVTGQPYAITIQRTILMFFNSNPERDVVAWLITIPILALTLTLVGLVYYSGLRSLASILSILMEMEYNNRARG